MVLDDRMTTVVTRARVVPRGVLVIDHVACKTAVFRWWFYGSGRRKQREHAHGQEQGDSHDAQSRSRH